MHELRSFKGVCAYYRCFAKKLSYIARPLHDLKNKNSIFVWSKKESDLIETLKDKLISQSILILSNLSKPFEVHCDAFGNSLRAMLLQKGHAITYENRRLIEHEKNVGMYEKKLLAIFACFRFMEALCPNHSIYFAYRSLNF